MSQPVRTSLWVGAAVAVTVWSGCTSDAALPPGTIRVAQEQQSAWVRNFNPFLPPGMSRWPTVGGVHEPLAIYDRVAGAYVPWLATSWRWEGDAVVVTLREGVSWSDGALFGPADVVATFELLRRSPALQGAGVWRALDGVRADGGDVVFTFATPLTPVLDELLAVPIVPAHVWSSLPDPLAFAAPSPVGTGPFTEVRRFTTQVFELGRNPRYWQPGRPGLDALRFEAMSSNDQVALALAHGELDWAGAFIPAVARTFVARDPAHHVSWSPPLGGMVMLYANALRPPLDRPDVRKALSLLLDRSRMVRLGLHDQTEPASATGLSDGMAAWRDDAVTCDWIAHDATRAEALLDAAGVTRGPDGVRRWDGAPWAVEVSVVTGWSDQVRAARLVVDHLAEAGISASLRATDFGTWLHRLQTGAFDVSFGWTLEGPSAYPYWRHLMDPATVEPAGVAASANWQRVGDGDAGALIAALGRAAAGEEQRRLAVALQARACEVAPAIPLYPNPAWGQASTRRATGFPSAEDPWALLSPNHPPEPARVLAALEPR